MKKISEVLSASGSFDPKQKINSSTKPTDFIGSETVIIATTGIGSTTVNGKTVSYSEYSQEAVKNAKIIGLMQNFQMNQMRQNPTIFEIGSAGKYLVHSSRVGGGLRLSRVVYNAANMLAALYPYDRSIAEDAVYGKAYGKQWLLNLAEDLFSEPIGITVIFRDAKRNIAAGAFFEHVTVSSHGLGVASATPNIGENVDLQYERVIPMFTNGTDTMKGQA